MNPKSGRTTKYQLKIGKSASIGYDALNTPAIRGSRPPRHTVKYTHPFLGSANVLVASSKCRGIPKVLTGVIHLPRRMGAKGEMESSVVGFIFL